MTISDEIASEVLSKSARHCCVCRNFLPLKIQVHHIREQSDGGTNDFDNLMPICIQCHSDIHTIPHMTRKFTEKELKKCRDNVYDMVACGKLPATKPMTRNELEVVSSLLAYTLRNNKDEDNLSDEAIELLSIMLCERSPIFISKVPTIGEISNSDLCVLSIGSQQLFPKERQVGQYPKSIIELLARGLIQSKGNELEITEKGEKLVSKLVQTTATYTQKKVKCLKCGLHFIICTWERDRHDSSSIHCPECGQNESLFLVWTQQKFGFIFQDVPGKSTVYDVPRK
ncbi:HNH endonuclease [Desulfitobacterium chlororespirans]|uniref:HNH endonuclease n=1 Tax=Desulfitobacterium chlororespirans DSM 11544 TaxID=1121395 RepID=A0A1M7V069_9FIRM|nr:HNH endonuclease [Desulfitobacterium chlororespirans]SHN88594.1 HNH endonuclease [Desulfitobacterium chlororespirans DSM 11544]